MERIGQLTAEAHQLPVASLSRCAFLGWKEKVQSWEDLEELLWRF